MQLAREAAQKSTCKSRQIGVVIVNRYGRHSKGWNSPPPGTSCEGVVCPRRERGFQSGEGLEHCPVIHAEMMAIANAAKYGFSTWEGTIYCWCCEPCKWCAGPIIQAGIKRIVHLDQPTPDNVIHNLGRELLEASDIIIETIPEAEIPLVCSEQTTN